MCRGINQNILRIGPRWSLRSENVQEDVVSALGNADFTRRIQGRGDAPRWQENRQHGRADLSCSRQRIFANVIHSAGISRT